MDWQIEIFKIKQNAIKRFNTVRNPKITELKG